MGGDIHDRKVDVWRSIRAIEGDDGARRTTRGRHTVGHLGTTSDRDARAVPAYVGPETITLHLTGTTLGPPTQSLPVVLAAGPAHQLDVGPIAFDGVGE